MGYVFLPSHYFQELSVITSRWRKKECDGHTSRMCEMHTYGDLGGSSGDLPPKLFLCLVLIWELQKAVGSSLLQNSHTDPGSNSETKNKWSVWYSIYSSKDSAPTSVSIEIPRRAGFKEKKMSLPDSNNLVPQVHSVDWGTQRLNDSPGILRYKSGLEK